MSYHIYIAREGFKETPIHHDAWLSAARQCEELSVDEKLNWRGNTYHRVALKADRSAVLSLTTNGLIKAQAPSMELVHVMFRLADVLDAGVYSQRLKRYRSANDWLQRTKKYRHSLRWRLARFAKFTKKHQRRFVSWILIIGFTALMCWLVVSLSESSGWR